jgi:hypothetical protein
LPNAKFREMNVADVIESKDWMNIHASVED